MIELHRVEANELANKLHSIGPNRVFVKPVDERISGEVVHFEGRERKVRSVCKVNYTSAGGLVLFVKFKALPRTRLQAKDLSTLTILQFLAQFESHEWKSWWANLPNRDWGDWSIANQFPEINQSNERVLLRKMSRLVVRGYVGGCDCGCRGDFYLKDKGRTLLRKLLEQADA